MNEILGMVLRADLNDDPLGVIKGGRDINERVFLVVVFPPYHGMLTHVAYFKSSIKHSRHNT